MTLRQLRYFLGVLRAGSLTAAARSLHVAQPAVGMQIRALEDELGVGLLTRHARGVTPTEAGALLARLAGRILGEVEGMRREVMATGRRSVWTDRPGAGRPVRDFLVLADHAGDRRRDALLGELLCAARALPPVGLELAADVVGAIARQRGG